MDTKKIKNNVAILSVTSNAFLMAIKLGVGIVIGSISVISAAIHSGVDLVVAIIALFAVRRSGKPADQSHPYGHGKIENVAGTIEAVLIFFAAGCIIYEAVRELFNPQPMEEISWGIAVMAISACVNFIVSTRLFNVGVTTDSIALRANGTHLRTDVYTSAGVMAGLLLYKGIGLVAPEVQIWWIDPVVAILVALVIGKTAYELTTESAKDLLDARLPEEEEAIIKNEIYLLYPAVYGFHHLRSRKSGPYRFFDFHLVVAENSSMHDSHNISKVLETKIKKHFNSAMVEIHLEPCEHLCKRYCRAQCNHLERKKHVDA